MSKDDLTTDERLSAIEESLTPGVQRADPTSKTTDLEAKMNEERVERDAVTGERDTELAARLASLKIIEDRADSAHREQLASKLAYERGMEAARIEAHLNEHDRHFKDNNGDIKLLLDKANDMSDLVNGLLKREEGRDQVAAALAAAVKQSALDQLGGRQFFIGLASLFVAVMAVLVAAGVLR